jgi:FemAB-related protein (PEP-CTERM system-associated)
MNDVQVHQQELPSDWNDFVTGHPKGSWYHLSHWKELIEDSFGHKSYYLSLRRDGRLAGILPLILVESVLFGRLLVSPAYGRYGDICAEDATAEDAILSRAKSLARELSVHYMEIRNVEPIDDRELIVKTSKQTFWLDLAEDEEAMWKAFRSEIRNRARKAETAGCVTSIGRAECLDDFYYIFSRHMRELGTPVYGKNFFENLMRLYGDDARIITTHISGKLVGAGVLVFYKDSVAVPWISSLESAFKAYPNNAMYMGAIRYAIQKKCRHFDFGTSNAGSGNAEFKLRWGARMVQLNWQYYLVRKKELPDLSPSSNKFSLAVRAWQRLPLWATTTLGPRVTRMIP